MTQKDLDLLTEKQIELYSIYINGKNIAHQDLMLILIRKMAEIHPYKWVENKQLSSSLDIRLQLFIRLDMAFVHYHQSIISTLNSLELLWNSTTNNLGYYKKYTFQNLIFREVYLRTSFFEKVFFTIDYFIQQMNTNISFHTAGTSHKKQQYFKFLLEKLELDNEELEVNDIVDELNKFLKEENEDGNLFQKKGRGKKIRYYELYNYFIALRNVFHNNGYSGKNMNNLNLGGIPIEIVKGKQIRFSQDVVVGIVLTLMTPLERIIEKTFELYPNSVWQDTYANDLKVFMEN